MPDAGLDYLLSGPASGNDRFTSRNHILLRR